MKTTKTTTVMSTMLCASALMLPLAMPIAAQAQVAPDKTVTFQVTVNGTPCQNATYWGYTGAANSDNIRYLQLADGDGDGVYTGTSIPFSQDSKVGVRLLEGTGVQPDPSPWPGSPAADFPGDPSRTIADFGTEQQDGFTYLTLNDNFLAATTIDGCATAPAPSATPAPAAAPSEVVVAFLDAVHQSLIGPVDVDYSPCLSTALEQRLANGEFVYTLLGIQSSYPDFMVSAATLDGAGRATLTATLNYGTSSSQRTFTLVQENGAWQIERIVLAETGTPALTLTETVVGFLTAVQQNPGDSAISQYFGTGPLIERLIDDGETALSLLGIQTVYRDFSVDSVTLESPGNATVIVTLNFEQGSVQRTLKVSQGPTWGIRNIVIDQEQPAPSATVAPSAQPSATAKPAATAKPSGVASATPAPSSAPSKLPDTGAAENMLGGLLAAGAALAASGGYLLRRRAR